MKILRGCAAPLTLARSAAFSSPGYPQVEISNVATAENGALDMETFLQDPGILSAADAPLAQSAFFAQRQAEHRHSTKDPARKPAAPSAAEPGVATDNKPE